MLVYRSQSIMLKNHHYQYYHSLTHEMQRFCACLEVENLAKIVCAYIIASDMFVIALSVHVMLHVD